MQLIVDCGATKTDWGIVEAGKVVRSVRTPGFNLVQTPEETLNAILSQAAQEIGPGVEEVHFYAAGHHATERYGVCALGEYLANRFGIEHLFIDCPNPA